MIKKQSAEIDNKRSPNDKKREEMLQSERALLLLSNVGSEFIKTHDADIGDGEYVHYTEIIKTERRVTKEHNNVLVMLHGYGGFGATYYKLASKLANDFHLILVDLPGFGFSSRHSEAPFECIETCLDFFVSRIKRFVDAISLPFFSLVGHSLGAYLSAHFFRVHHEQVLNLFLLSPAGMNSPPEDQLQVIESRFKTSFTRLVVRRFMKKVFEKKLSPFEMIFWPLKPVSMRIYLRNKRFNFSANERDLVFKLQYHFSYLPQSSERCIGYLMHYGPKSNQPVIDILTGLRARNNSIRIIFGDADQMDKELTASRIEELDLPVRISLAKDSDHQLLFQNTEFLFQEISEGCKRDLRIGTQIPSDGQKNQTLMLA
jgi:pimeloyl-ACP methyl ester carboxylesterase